MRELRGAGVRLAARPMRALVLSLALVAIGVPAMADSPERITLQQLEAMFARIRSETKWNADAALSWSYFFKHQELTRLEMAAMHLERAGYEVAGMGKIQGQPAFRLRVKKVEAHTPATLDVRNAELYDFAAQAGLTYEGMDVGPAEQN